MYYQSRAPHEDFVTWFLKRYLGFYGKLCVAIALWAVWFLFLWHIDWIIYFLKGIVSISLVVIIYEIYQYRKGKYENNKSRTKSKK